MDAVYFRGLCDFINENNLNIQKGTVRKGREVINKHKHKNIYESDNFIQLEDIVSIDKELLRYRMGDSSKLKMLNIALVAKGHMADKNPDFQVDIQTSSTRPGSFTLYFRVEAYKKLSIIQLSIDRTYNVVSKPSNKAVEEVFANLIEEFMILSSTP